MKKLGILTALVALATISPVLADGCPYKGGCEGKKGEKKSEASAWNFGGCGGCDGQKKDTEKKKDAASLSSDIALAGFCGDSKKDGSGETK